MQLLLQWAPWLFLAFPSAVSAAIIDNSVCDFTTGNIHADCVPRFIGHLIQWVLGFVGAFCLMNIMIGGYQIALGSAIGDKEAGKSRVLWALVGLLVAMASYGILNVIITTLFP
ncbi:hypothetical protein HYS30_03275 [Candidatus Peregrinibacteria bacterium]|nr:hypothetical protein [Candidatus Peregrinibacteria bacterium]MBI2524035.1 hypothetical protein [Candidatus Peregrinibacteria bacterium]